MSLSSSATSTDIAGEPGEKKIPFPRPSKHLKPPVGFEELLSSIYRQVLKDQPKNIIPFISSYLTRMVNVREGKRESLNDLSKMKISGLPASLEEST